MLFLCNKPKFDPKLPKCYNSCIVNETERQMGFEKTVLDKVAKVLEQDRQAYFVNGTLFVQASESQARRVFSMLFKDYNGRVQVSVAMHGEFAYDFTG
ncbi:hypothetical protein UFOVP190_312 [uncultured Caudovirales phage]|uniref:Uncharacterized protein n=1 Tax=uncultured Caudovirales phage TaxID=2100421 RepID=A0A6J7WKJ5_9CAUD|nr:hypothetical protein UFOVP190_312 [uncultured Caudovirales phage]